jgi:hypothetical protein
MLPLLNAIYSKFTTDGALSSSFPGGLHRDRAPEGTAMPYVVSHVLSSTTELSYGATSCTATQVRFSAYGVGHDATGALIETLISHFDNALLSLSAGTNDSVVRLGEGLPVLHRHDAAGNDVWEWSVTYEYMMTS